MKEQVVSFEVAKLAKELGFDLPTVHFYFEDGEFRENYIQDTYGYRGDPYTVYLEELKDSWNNEFLTTKNGDRCFGCLKGSKYFETFSAPTQSLLQKWLREKEGIHIFIMPIREKSRKSISAYRVNMLIPTEGTYRNITLPLRHNSYEEALEAALLEALKTLQ